MATVVKTNELEESTLVNKKANSSEYAHLHQHSHNPQIVPHVSTNITTEDTSSKPTRSRDNSTSATPLIEKSNASNNKFRRFFQHICCCCCELEESSCQPENNQTDEVLNNENIRDDEPVVLETSDLTADHTSQLNIQENINEMCLSEEGQSEHSVDEVVTEVLEQIKADITDNEISINDQFDRSDSDINTQLIQEQNHFETSNENEILPDNNENAQIETITKQEQPEVSHYDTLSIDDDKKEKLTQEYAREKAYYETFLDINHKNESDIKQAEELTKSILSKLPSGNPSDMNTACHVLNNLFKSDDKNCLFFDSSKGMTFHDTFQNAADLESDNRPIVLQFSSSEGLGGIDHVPTQEEELKLAHTLNNAIQKEQSHPVLDDIIERLARIHGVRKEDIAIQNIFTGTLNTVYTVTTPSGNITITADLLIQNYTAEFPNIISVRVHPLLDRPSFDISMFDPRGNKTFPNIPETFNVGPSGRQQLYTQPAGWTRYGLKVLGKYDNDYWLHPFRHSQNWFRAFHGTRRATNADFGNNNQIADQKYASVDALSSIYTTGFRMARVHAHGPGVYCSPSPLYPEGSYVGKVPVETENGTKYYKCMLQVAVYPDGVTFHDGNKVWVVADPKNIRPYGILIKEAT